MSESNYRPDGTGVVMGDTKAMPDRGTSTGMTGFNTHNDMSIDQDATNRMGNVADTGSDPHDQSHPIDPSLPHHGSLGTEAA